MKRLFLLLSLITFSLNAQQKETVDLKWTIADTLTYKTLMQDTISDESTEKTKSDSILVKMSDMFKAMQKQFSNLKYETKLFPSKNGNVDIIMMFKKEQADTTENVFSGLAKMNENVVLRGKVSPEGELLSFYYEEDQKNLISMLFELPTEPVAIGDEWELKVNMISLKQNFKADTLYKNNIVRLKDVEIRNGNKIAVIEYDLEEYVSGDLGNVMMTMFSKDQSDKKTFMKMSYKATAEFDLDKGYWVVYDGIMDIETNFSLMGMSGNKRTVFKLIAEK